MSSKIMSGSLVRARRRGCGYPVWRELRLLFNGTPMMMSDFTVYPGSVVVVLNVEVHGRSNVKWAKLLVSDGEVVWTRCDELKCVGLGVR